MKRKLILFIAAYLFLSTFCFGGGDPPFKMQLGNDFSLPRNHDEICFSGNSREGFLCFSHQKGKDVKIQYFDTGLKLLNENTIAIKDFPNYYTIEKMVIMGGRYYLFISTTGKSETLWVQEFDVSKGERVGSIKQLINLPKVSKQTIDHWVLLNSADNSKFAITYTREHNHSWTEPDVIGYYVFDSEMKPLWNKETTLPSKNMRQRTFMVDNKGTAYILGKNWIDSNMLELELVSFSASAENPVAHANIGKRNPQDMTMVEGRSGNIICTGYYSNDDVVGYKESSNGLFLFSYQPISKSLSPLYKGFYNIPDALVKENQPKKELKKIDKNKNQGKDIEVPDLKFRNMTEMEDGSIIVCGEQYTFESLSTTYTAPSGSTNNGASSRYTFGDIYITKISSDTTHDWVKKIPKRQFTAAHLGSSVGNDYRVGSAYVGFYLYPQTRNAYVFYVDDPENFSLGTDKAPKSYDSDAGIGGELVCAKIDERGNITKSSILNDGNLKVRTGDFSNMGDGKVLGLVDVNSGLTFNMFNYVQKQKPCLLTIEK